MEDTLHTFLGVSLGIFAGLTLVKLAFWRRRPRWQAMAAGGPPPWVAHRMHHGHCHGEHRGRCHGKGRGPCHGRHGEASAAQADAPPDSAAAPVNPAAPDA